MAAVKHAMQQCCLQLRSKVARKQAAAEQRERKRTLSKYIPNAASALMQVLQVCSRQMYYTAPIWCMLATCIFMRTPFRKSMPISVRNGEEGPGLGTNAGDG